MEQFRKKTSFVPTYSKEFSLVHAGYGAHTVHIISGFVSAGTRHGANTDQSSASSAEIKNAWSYTSIPRTA